MPNTKCMKTKLLMILICFAFQNPFAQTIALQNYATGFTNPVAITHAGDDRLFVVERGGAIKIIQPGGSVLSTPFLSLTNSTIVSGGERGLLGLAFHPNYTQNRLFFVNYTRAGDGATVIARYQTFENQPNLADPNSAVVLLTIPQPFTNHNGGSIVFGPDGYLYIGMGDGGSANDPQNHGQNMNSLLGKMLRIDVNQGATYGIPPDNPYVGQSIPNEIWAAGLRNPWKFSFNRLNGDLWIADVGQNAREEINRVVAPLSAGLNFGWRCYEANLPYITNGCGPIGNYTFPVSTYPLGSGYCSITGGYAYTGSQYPNFQNKYFFADYCANRIGWIPFEGGTIQWTSPFTGNFTTFGEDVNGELYIAGINNGVVSRIIDASLSLEDQQRVSLVLYPNPAKSELHIRFDDARMFEKIEVYNLTGRIMYSQNFQNVNQFVLNVSGFNSGMYILTLKDANGQPFTQKFIVE